MTIDDIETASQNCFTGLNLGECPEWIDGLESGATPGQGATPAQQSSGGSGMAASFGQMWLPSGTLDEHRIASPPPCGPTHHNACDCRDAARDAELDAMRARVAKLEAEAISGDDRLSHEMAWIRTRVATLEAECVAWRENARKVYWRAESETVSSYEAFIAITDARAATGPIGGVA